MQLVCHVVSGTLVFFLLFLFNLSPKGEIPEIFKVVHQIEKDFKDISPGIDIFQKNDVQHI